MATISRHQTRNKNWNIYGVVSADDTVTLKDSETVFKVLLMDLRDELQKLNAVFACHNFQQVPAVLRQIRANTSKPKRKKAAK